MMEDFCDSETVWPLSDSISVIKFLHLRERGQLTHRQYHRLADNVALRQGVTDSLPVPQASKTVFQMAFSPDGKLLAAAHGDHSIRLYSVGSGALVNTLHGHPRTPWTLHFHPIHAHILASACLSGEVRVWDLRTGHCDIQRIKDSSDGRETVVGSISFHPIDPVLAVASHNDVTFWDWTRHRRVMTWRFKGEHCRVRWVKFGPRGRELFTGTANPESDLGNGSGVTLTPHDVSSSEERLQYARLLNTFAEIVHGGSSAASVDTAESVQVMIHDENSGDNDLSVTSDEVVSIDKISARLKLTASRIREYSARNLSASSRVSRRSHPDLNLFRSQLLGEDVTSVVERAVRNSSGVDVNQPRPAQIISSSSTVDLNQPRPAQIISSSSAVDGNQPRYTTPSVPRHFPIRYNSSSDNVPTNWIRLERWQGHRDYGVAILDDTVNQLSSGFRSHFNRSIASLFTNRGDTAVAANIMDKDYKIRRWNLLELQKHYLNWSSTNIVVHQCKLHTDSSVALNKTGTLLATFVPNSTLQSRCVLSVFGTVPGYNFAQCLYTKQFGPNAISVSWSPRSSDLLLVGLASRRLHVYSRQQVVGQVLRLARPRQGERSCEDVSHLRHLATEPDPSAHVSINTCAWLPEPHAGLAYATITGQVYLTRPWSGSDADKCIRTVGTQTARTRQSVSTSSY